MASPDQLVVLAALLVGLVTGGLLGWASLLLRTGHPARPQQGELPLAPRPAPSGGAPGAGAYTALAVLLLLAAASVVLLAVPTVAPGCLEGVELPGGPVTVAAVALVAVLGLAVPAWRGAAR